jgi:hypothetical protein
VLGEEDGVGEPDVPGACDGDFHKGSGLVVNIATLNGPSRFEANSICLGLYFI